MSNYHDDDDGWENENDVQREPIGEPWQGPPSRDDLRRWAGTLGEVIALNLKQAADEYPVEYVYADARLAASRALDCRYHKERWSREYEAFVVSLALDAEARRARRAKLFDSPRVQRQRAEVERLWAEYLKNHKPSDKFRRLT